jgi:hypothetical protein
MFPFLLPAFHFREFFSQLFFDLRILKNTYDTGAFCISPVYRRQFSRFSQYFSHFGAREIRRQVRCRLHPPPRSPMRTGVSWSLTNSPQFAGIFADSNAGRAVSGADRGRDSVDFDFQSLGLANPFLASA